MSVDQHWLRGKTAVITGAASGIGAGLAQHAASMGMRLMLADVQEARLEALASTLSAEVTTVITDVTLATSVEQLAERAFDAFGQVDLVFNNAGIMVMGKTWEIDRARYEKLMAVNVGGAFNVVHAFIPRMMAHSSVPTLLQ